jgi:hypothetical protein
MLALAAGCASVMPPADLTFQGKVDYALAQTTAARKICNDLVDRNRMDAEEGQVCQDFADTARELIETAGATGDVDQLRAVQATLLRLEAYLQEKDK